MQSILTFQPAALCTSISRCSSLSLLSIVVAKILHLLLYDPSCTPVVQSTNHYVELPELDHTRIPPIRAAIDSALQGLFSWFAELIDGGQIRMNKMAVDGIVFAQRSTIGGEAGVQTMTMSTVRRGSRRCGSSSYIERVMRTRAAARKDVIVVPRGRR